MYFFSRLKHGQEIDSRNVHERLFKSNKLVNGSNNHLEIGGYIEAWHSPGLQAEPACNNHLEIGGYIEAGKADPRQLYLSRNNHLEIGGYIEAV